MIRGGLTSLFRRFSRDNEGVAAVEFALIMPVLLALYFGSMEASVLFTADKRVNTISATVGDLVAQWNPDDGTIPTATMATYFSAATGIIAPYSSAGVKQVVSLIFVKSDGTTKVLWSSASGTGATARTINQPYTPLVTTSMTDQVSRGGCVVAAETIYPYKPLFGQVFKTPLNLSHTNYFVPRYGGTAVINLQTTSLTTTACTTGS
ncbi:MAG: TadE/TadG family type IV pilus assembly protein [Devosia sp.]